jgi:hypothetical protein
MMLVGMSDPGLVVLPTHRLFVQPAVATAADLVREARRLLQHAELLARGRRGGRGGLARTSNSRRSQGTIGLYTAGDQAWTMARITPGGPGPDGEVASDHGAAWRSLGVSILHRLVIGELLGAKEIPTPGYVHLVREVVEGLRHGRSIRWPRW